MIIQRFYLGILIFLNSLVEKNGLNLNKKTILKETRPSILSEILWGIYFFLIMYLLYIGLTMLAADIYGGYMYSFLGSMVFIKGTISILLAYRFSFVMTQVTFGLYQYSKTKNTCSIIKSARIIADNGTVVTSEIYPQLFTRQGGIDLNLTLKTPVFMITHWDKDSDIAEQSGYKTALSILYTKCDAIVYFSYETEDDKRAFQDAFNVLFTEHEGIKLHCLKQVGKGKRHALVECMMNFYSNYYQPNKYLLVTMDGDSLIGERTLLEGLAFMETDQNLGVITFENRGLFSNESPSGLIADNRKRFIERAALMFAMLVATGRGSILRAEIFAECYEELNSQHIIDKGNIATQKSGDDKWFLLQVLKAGYYPQYLSHAEAIYCIETSGNEKYTLFDRLFWFTDLVKKRRYKLNAINNRDFISHAARQQILMGKNISKMIPIVFATFNQFITMRTCYVMPIFAIWGTIYVSKYFIFLSLFLALIMRLGKSLGLFALSRKFSFLWPMIMLFDTTIDRYHSHYTAYQQQFASWGTRLIFGNKVSLVGIGLWLLELSILLLLIWQLINH